MCDSLGSGQRRERQKRRLPQKSAWDSGLDLEELRERARSAIAYRFPSCPGLRVPGTCPLEMGVGIITLEQGSWRSPQHVLCCRAKHETGWLHLQGAGKEEELYSAYLLSWLEWPPNSTFKYF